VSFQQQPQFQQQYQPQLPPGSLPFPQGGYAQQPQQMYQQVQVPQAVQLPPQQAALAPAKKARSSRKPWTPERWEELMKTAAHCAKLIGTSYTKPADPASVPKHAPDSGEWNGIAHRLLATVPVYKDLFENRKKVNHAEKTRNGGLDQNVYVTRNMTEFLNASGILGPHKIPVDVAAGNLGIATRALLTSSIVAYVEARGLKHPVSKKYIAPDQYLSLMMGLKTAKPKVEKKKKEDAKPKKPSPKVQVLERDGQQIAHFSFDAIPTISGFFILDLAPRNVTEQQKQQIAAIRIFLHELTEVRKATRKDQAKAVREATKAQKIQNSIVPTQVAILNFNPGVIVPQQLPTGQPQQQVQNVNQ
jgi:hypothetical protein